MGLDQYLYARKTFEVTSDEGKRVLAAIGGTERFAGEIAKWGPDGGDVYVSGWDFNLEKAYPVVSDVVGFKPHEGSPHFYVRLKGDQLEVEGVVMYWRKANAVHRWFVEWVQGGADDCDMYRVHSEALAGLVDAAERVTVDHALAEDLLPSQGGFFFGSTEYDEWYFADIEETARTLKQVMPSLAGAGVEFYYRSSW